MSFISSKAYYNPYDPFIRMDIWDPFQGFNYGAAATTSNFVNAKIEWKETPEAHVLKADLPGLKKEEVKVELEQGNVLCLTGEKSFEKEEKVDNQWYHLERSSGRFIQRFRLPDNAKANKIKAHMENGVLTITIPKKDMNKKITSKPPHVF